jgi:4-amino-4-deoxy-L-arabinose transferase-like glycosyltransferase
VTSNLKQRLASFPPLAWALVLAIACLAPFANKAFHIDDTLFLRAAEHIQKHPINFYGFTMNWFGTPMPMIRCFDNPPLACYYMALVASVAGWSEVTMHLAFLIPALAAVWGTFSLARNYCSRPIVAAAVAVLTPVFLISATTVMCDVMLLAFWVWSLVLFERGLQKNDWRPFLISGLLAGLAVLTKFTALALIPLLGAYGFIRYRRLGWWILPPLIVVLFAGAYELATYRLYGRGLLFTATALASEDRSARQGGVMVKNILGLGFVGGSFLTTLFYVPLLWSRRRIFLGACMFVACMLLLPRVGQLKPFLWRDGHLNWLTSIASALFTVGGIHLILLAWADFWERRDPTSFLLVVWILGIFVFATTLNWTINGRSLLPMLPAVGILVARRLELRTNPSEPRRAWQILWPALPAAAVSLLLVQADYNLADTNRVAAAELCAKYLKHGNGLYFEGHWGFQYYMEKLGAKAMDVSVPKLDSGDILILPNNSEHLLRRLEVLEHRPNPHLSIMNNSAGAGFYASIVGPLPFAIENIEPCLFFVYEVK